MWLGRQWAGKAGSFGYQDRTGWLHIEAGSESNVIGLPLELLAKCSAERRATPAESPLVRRHAADR